MNTWCSNILDKDTKLCYPGNYMIPLFQVVKPTAQCIVCRRLDVVKLMIDNDLEIYLPLWLAVNMLG